MAGIATTAAALPRKPCQGSRRKCQGGAAPARRPDTGVSGDERNTAHSPTRVKRTDLIGGPTKRWKHGASRAVPLRRTMHILPKSNLDGPGRGDLKSRGGADELAKSRGGRCDRGRTAHCQRLQRLLGAQEQPIEGL